MVEIKLRADECRTEAKHVQDEAASASDQMTKLRGRLNNLSSSFTGQTAIAFDDTFNDWKIKADQVIDALMNLGTFLDTAANTIEATDQEIAARLKSQ